MDFELENKWNQLRQALSAEFGETLDLQGILFLIGVQELGKGNLNFSKDQKAELLHIAVCTLLEPYGFYTFAGKDKDGWPHWQSAEKIPALKPPEQERLMKQAIVAYFNEKE